MTDLHFPWCDPDLCDMGTGGNYVVHRSKPVELQTWTHGKVHGQIYRVVNPGRPTETTVLLDQDGDGEPWLTLSLPELMRFVAELESLQQSKVVSQT